MPTIKGKIRGYGRQLASYLLSEEKNEWAKILDVDGRDNPDALMLKQALIDFSLSEQLTKSRQGIYHASINPAEEDAAKFSDAHWLEMADLLGKELGFSEQRRVCVLHKNRQGRVHLHIAWERYDHEKCKMIPIDHNYRKQLKARKAIAQRFNLQMAPERNERRPAIKETLTRLWRESVHAAAFIRAAKEQGYTITKGYDRTPFMVVDDKGRSYKLFSHLEGVKRKEVRERFKGMALPEEQETIAFVRTQQAITTKQPQQATASETQNEFLKNLKKVREQRPQHRPRMG